MSRNGKHLITHPIPVEKHRIEEAVLISLLILSMLGIGITHDSPPDGYWYWIIMVFVFAVAAIIVGWVHAQRQKNSNVKGLLVDQALHWSGSMMCVIVVFSLLQVGVLNARATASVILLILALSTFLDGIRIGWRFSMVGLFLGSTVMAMAYVEKSMWLILLIAAAIVVFTIYLDNRRQSSD